MKTPHLLLEQRAGHPAALHYVSASGVKILLVSGPRWHCRRALGTYQARTALPAYNVKDRGTVVRVYSLPLDVVRAALPEDCTLRRTPAGEYLLRRRGAPAGEGYYSPHLDDILATARLLASPSPLDRNVDAPRAVEQLLLAGVLTRGTADGTVLVAGHETMEKTLPVSEQLTLNDVVIWVARTFESTLPFARQWLAEQLRTHTTFTITLD